MTDIYRVALFGHRRIDRLGEVEERLVPILNELMRYTNDNFILLFL